MVIQTKLLQEPVLAQCAPPFMAKAILNFHIDYLTPSLTKKTLERILRNHSCAPLHKCGCDTFKWNTMRSEEAEVGLGARDKHR